ncbi:hypothetical protein ONZ51_g12255 [Trametes cubensis]|uniref:Uncharacterized protein n=1 Tax=Trametes cubensis TaxID=1111947 RepID=A0AAD7X723_9APHY|nr:hypothetical protein ONZ51_g12255 [Trametes cubensis]
MTLARRRAALRMSLFDSSCHPGLLGDTSTDDLAPPENDPLDSDRGTGTEVVNRLQHAVHGLVEDLDKAEKRWDARFAHIEEEAEQLMRRHGDICRSMRDSKRTHDGTTDRITQLEAEVLDLREVLSELTRSVGSAFREVKEHEEHRREVQRILSDNKNTLRADIHDLQRKIGTLELDTTVMKSQRGVDRARTERMEQSMAVLEATDGTIRNTLRRLERNMEEISDLSHNSDLAMPVLDEVPPRSRSLAEELICAEAFERMEEPDVEHHPLATLTLAGCESSSDLSSCSGATTSAAGMPDPTALNDGSTSQHPLPDDLVLSSHAGITDNDIPLWAHRSILVVRRFLKETPRTFAFFSFLPRSLFLTSLALLLCVCLALVGSSPSGHHMARVANRRPIWERSRT